MIQATEAHRSWMWRTVSIPLLAAIAYGPTLFFAFTGDDVGVVTNNLLIRSLGNVPRLFNQGYFARSGEVSYRPLVTFSYMIDWTIWGLRPVGFHLTNLVVHALTAWLMVAVVAALFRNRTLALLSGAVFAVFPAPSEAVAAIAYREDLLCGLFSLLAIWCALACPQGRWRHATWPAALVSLALALLAKEMALATPFVLGYLMLRRRPSPVRPSPVRPSRWFVAAVGLELGIYLLLRFVWLQNSLPLPLEPVGGAGMSGVVAAPLNALRIGAYYVLLNLIPAGVNIDYTMVGLTGVGDARLLVALLFLAALAAGVWRAPRGGPLRVGMAWFFLALVPVSNLAPLHSPVADRYLYLPSAGWSLAVAACFVAVISAAKPRFTGNHAAPDRGALPPFLCLLVVLTCFTFLTVLHTRIWRTNFALWQFGAERSPGKARPHLNFAAELAQRGRLDAARREWLATLDVDPRHPDPYNNIGNLFREAGNLEKAALLYARWLRYEPQSAHTLNNLAIVLRRRGKVDRAILTYQRALALAPRHAPAHKNLGMALLARGRPEEGLRHFRRSLRLDPRQRQAEALRNYVERLTPRP